MNIVVFDTETVSIDKPFCYNIGYVIYDTDNKVVLLQKDFVIEQVWHNFMLFSTAYYVNKKNIYINKMRARKTVMEKYGYVCQEMIRDFKNYQVDLAFAYNSPFDKKVFEFNCEWFKCNNPFDNIEIKDIMCFTHSFIAFSQAYQDFLENTSKHYETLLANKSLTKEEKDHYKELQASLFTESGNYSTSAENMYRYITNQVDYIEEHTALEDSKIELEILNYCIDNYPKATYNGNYKRYSSVPRKIARELVVQDTNGIEHKFPYLSKRASKDLSKIILKNC